VSLNISREVLVGVGPMEAGYNWRRYLRKPFFHIWGHEGRDRSLDVRSYDPAILLAQK